MGPPLLAASSLSKLNGRATACLSRSPGLRGGTSSPKLFSCVHSSNACHLTFIARLHHDDRSGSIAMNDDGNNVHNRLTKISSPAKSPTMRWRLRRAQIVHRHRLFLLCHGHVPSMRSLTAASAATRNRKGRPSWRPLLPFLCSLFLCSLILWSAASLDHNNFRVESIRLGVQWWSTMIWEIRAIGDSRRSGQSQFPASRLMGGGAPGGASKVFLTGWTVLFPKLPLHSAPPSSTPFGKGHTP